LVIRLLTEFAACGQFGLTGASTLAADAGLVAEHLLDRRRDVRLVCMVLLAAAMRDPVPSVATISRVPLWARPRARLRKQQAKQRKTL
jgi:hypothetical protein